MIDWLYTQTGFSIVLMTVVIGAVMTAVGYCTFFERKISAWVQDRIGPNRAGPWGLLQPLADGVKFILKEDKVPAHVDRFIFSIAPLLSFVVAIIGIAVIPWGGVWQPDVEGVAPLRVQIASIDVGLLYVLAVGSLGVYGVVLGSWASNNKYAFYGGLRAAAQMLSYEIPMGLVILVVVLTTGALRLEDIVAVQVAEGWNILYHPLAFIILFITALAETNRAPFDLAECEQELVAGFHTEYSSMKFAMFFLGEYTHMIVASAVMTVLFLGGWHLPWVGLGETQTSLLGIAVQLSVMAAKIAGFIFLFMLIRWTLPRFRFDQVMKRAWKALVPLTLAQVALTTMLVYYNSHRTLWATATDVACMIVFAIVLALTPGHVTGRQDHLTPVRRSVGMASHKGAV
jgi:NADH-quinone oxidoreductase subunit H